ncbi:Multidrug efflux pump subunit AcrA precursor [compost metagenome]
MKVLLKTKSSLLPVLLLSSLLAACGGKTPEVAPPLKKVEVVTLQARSFALTSELPGRVTPVRIAEVRARVAGIVLERQFEEGADVKAGQVLFRIDPAPFKAALSRAEGELARADAMAFDAESVVRRYKPLVEIQAISQQDFDTAQTTHKSAIAAKRSAQADVETAKLNLEYATVRAPISGRIGRALVTEGALVGQGEATPMATIQQLDPIFVDFTQSVSEVIQTKDALARGTLAKNENGGASIVIAIEGSKLTRQGELLFSDIGVDQTSNQVTLRGRFSNRDNLLLPGMYVRVRTEQGVDPQSILVPQRAVSRSTDGKPQVLLVNANNVVEARLVETGTMHGSEWRILSGLKAGEQVIVGGANGVKPDDKVKVESTPKKETQQAQQLNKV